jgi:hypothetical protein
VSKALVFILITLLAAQSLGMSPVMVPDTNSANTAAAMPCHEQVTDQTSPMEHQGAMDDCCDQADCNCCWGSGGLLNVQLRVNPGPTPFSVLLSVQGDMPRSAIQNLYRPPTFA